MDIPEVNLSNLTTSGTWLEVNLTTSGTWLYSGTVSSFLPKP